jgi:hypothetical protein
VLLCPRVWVTEDDPDTGRKRRYKAPIFLRYQRILDIEKLVKPEVWRAYKEELFGTDTEVFSLDYFNELDVVKHLGIDFLAWETEYDNNLKARLIAKCQLQNVVDLVRRHDQLQRDKDRKRAAEAKANAEAQAKGRPGASRHPRR